MYDCSIGRFPCLLAPSSLRTPDRTADLTKTAMDTTARIATLAYRDLPFYEYAGEFCKLTATVDDAALNRLIWLGANYHHPMNLPDTTGLSWREGIFQCLGSVRA
ncbi:hypothetical protein G5714_011721 [Onychostoma macrolepis]|uniref:Uncharacterized protein n=1 Tax=Onychostoma macrolepis TaxID=369639 RepID=A0A7J6CJ64_9TELE|nr:hypothetical protein G5714_011721 [Onychostoma macrolepis]